MKCLVTGFEPFGGESVNPSKMIVCALSDQINGCQICKEILPVSFQRAKERLYQCLDALQPDLVVCIGQASQRAMISIEKIGINLMSAPIADEDGCQPENEPIVKGGPDGRFSSFPVEELVKTLKDHQIPVYESFSAGTYVCNMTLYCTMDWICANKPDCTGGFVHVPLLPQQTLNKPSSTPSMSLDLMCQGIHILLEELIRHKMKSAG